MLVDAARFRHDPVKSSLGYGEEDLGIDWRKQPAVCGYRKFVFRRNQQDEAVEVPVSATPATVEGLGVVVASDDGYIRCLDAPLVKVFWERRLQSSVYASLVVDRRRRRIIVAATNGLVVCFTLKGGVAWVQEVGAQIFATPTIAVASDLLVLAAFGSQALALHLEDGAIAFKRPVPRPWHANHGGLTSHRDPYASPVETPAGDLIVCCAEHVLCLAADGTELWRVDLGQEVKSSPVCIDQTMEVAVCSMSGRCVFLQMPTGHVTADVELGAQVTASPALSGGVLAIGTRDAAVHGLDVSSHALVWTRSQGAPRDFTSVTTLPDGSFIATTMGGNIVNLDNRDGRFRWETSQVLGRPNHDPAMHITPVATADGYLYCASYAGDFYQFSFRRHLDEGGDA